MPSNDAEEFKKLLTPLPPTPSKGPRLNELIFFADGFN
jgi:hypothetical protein